MANRPAFTTDPRRYPRVEACGHLLWSNAEGLATASECPSARTVAFYAGQMGLELGLVIAKLQPEWGEALLDELRSVASDPAQLAEAAASYREKLVAQVNLLVRLAQRIASQTQDPPQQGD